MFKRYALAAAAFVAGSAQAAPAMINCAKDRTVDERAICASVLLIQLDARMATLNDLILGLVPMGTREQIREEQREWLSDRRGCGARFICLRRTYEYRIEELESYFGRIREQGPF